MNEIKYEAVFGPQELFIDVNKDAVVVVRYDDIEVFFDCYSNFFDHLRAVGRGLSVDAPVIAMRSIIRTPTWTVADQKAGKLPEVGAEVMCMDNSLHEFVGESIHAGHWALRDGKTKKVFHTPAASVKPVETDEERQQREREEWCKKASFIIPSVTGGLISDLGFIHDALVSGELKMPGVRK